MNIEYPKQTKVKKAPSKKNTVKTKSTELENIKLQIDELSTQNLRAEQNANDILESTSQISRLSSQVATNTAGISTNADHIATNAQNISQLQADVQTNASYIQVLGATKQEVLTAGENITIQNNTISAHNTTYTAGANVQIVNDIISATDTTYTAGTGIDITNGVISATGGGLSSVTASDVDSELATQGQVLTADGQGGATWQNASGLTQEQSDKLDETYDYFLTHVVQPDPAYNPQTPSDYPTGTIFKTYDCYERDCNLYSTSTITVPTIYFCAEENSSADFYYEFNIESRTADTNIIISFYLNGNLINTDNLSLVGNESVNFRKNLYGITISTNTKANNIYFTIAQSGSSTIAVTYQKVQIFAPNADIFNKISPYCVEYIGGKYYVSDCSDGNAKLAVIDVENMHNISNLQFNNLGFEAQHLDIGRNMITYSDNTAEFDDTIYAYLTKQNKIIFKLASNSKTYSNSNLTNVDWLINRNTQFRFTANSIPTQPKYSQIISSQNNVSTGSLNTKYNDIVTICATKYLNKNVTLYLPNFNFAQIRSNGQAYLGYYNTNTDVCNINIGYGSKIKSYFTRIETTQNFSLAVFVKRYDKFIRYDCSLYDKSEGFIINNVTEIGSYDDFYLGANNDYFVVKNNVLEYHKF